MEVAAGKQTNKQKSHVSTILAVIRNNQMLWPHVHSPNFMSVIDGYNPHSLPEP